MKMSNESYQALRDAVVQTMRHTPLSVFLNEGLTEGLWLWQSLWRTPEIEGQPTGGWVQDRLYTAEDLNDSHIETALRAIARESRS